jgi:hypothetical protein
MDGDQARSRPLAPGSARVLRTILAASILCLIPHPASAADSRQITAAIDRGLQNLTTRQKNGHWEQLDAKQMPGDEFDTKSGQWTGRTALAVWTLLDGGKSATDPAVADAVKFLEKNPTDGVYALGIRTQVWNSLPPSPAVADAMRRDCDLLLTAGKTSNDMAIGFYGYLASDHNSYRYDHSVSQFGVLGMWAGAQDGLIVPRKYWEMTALSWMAHQAPDGSWAYNWAKDGPAPGTASMTAAGVATLFIAQDQLANAGAKQSEDFNSLSNFGGKEVSAVNAMRLKALWQTRAAAGGDSLQTAINGGFDWIAAHWDNVLDNDHLYYKLFGISRIGAASGRKFIGKFDWYKDGSDLILSRQREDGSFGDGDVPDTCLALLFLERGLAPVMVNKLQYADKPNAAGTPTPPSDTGHWNNRTRDANNLARWYGHSTERFFNWQVVNLSNGPDELHDSPILYLAGDQPLNFSPADENKLREFVEQGGLILGNADDGREAFNVSFRKLASHLFHDYEFRALPANSPIYTNEQFPRARWKTKPQIMGLSNGVRELMILVPHADPSKTWQTQATDHPEMQQLAADLYLYMADRDNLQYRMPNFIVRPDDKIPAGTPLPVARIYYGGNWNPEPGGMARLAAVAHNNDGIEITTTDVKLSSAAVSGTPETAAGELGAENHAASPIENHPHPNPLPVYRERGPEGTPTAILSNQKLAILTGSYAFTLSPAQRAALKAYVANGRTLFIDAAGGSSIFKTSAETEMTAIFGPDAAQLARPLDLTALPQSPIAKQLAAIAPVTFRRGTTSVIGKGDQLRLRGIVLNGRLAVIYSPEDVTEGLVGEPVDGVIGYSPATATGIMRAIARGLAGK